MDFTVDQYDLRSYFYQLAFSARNLRIFTFILMKGTPRRED